MDTAQTSTRYVVEWFDVVVMEDHPDHGADPDTIFTRGDDFPVGPYDSLAALDAALENRGLPPLSAWEAVDDEPGRFETQCSEDAQGFPITDDEWRADPERGLYLVDYSLSLSVITSAPFIRPPVVA